MTAYTNIPNALVQVGAKPFATTIQALRDNPLAIAEGAAGAPRLSGRAALLISDIPVTQVVAENTRTLNIGLTRTNGSLSTNSLTPVLGFTITVDKYSGSIRFKASHRRDGGTGGNSVLEVRKNGVAVQSWNASTIAVERTADISVQAGDIITWWHNRDSTAANGSILSLVSETADKSWQEQPLYRDF